MKLVCVATHSERGFPTLKKSALKHNWDFKVLGWGKKWKGFGMKIRLMRGFLEELPDNEIVVFVDAFDTIVLANPEEVMRKFKAHGSDVLFSIDHLGRLDPAMKFLNKRVFGATDDYSVNSGCYMGYVGKLKEFFNGLCDKEVCADSADDQKLVGTVIKHSQKDVNSEIFLNVLDSILPNPDENFYVKGDRVYYGEGEKLATPCFVSAPGAGDMEWIEKLGYPPFMSKREAMTVKLKKIPLYTKFLLPEIITLLLIALVLPPKMGLVLGVLLVLWVMCVAYS
jgi:hypothetical protein